MSDAEEQERKARETEYVTRLLHADTRMYGLLHFKREYVRQLLQYLRPNKKNKSDDPEE
ncbi:MAG TPA: hypothetical protein VMT62_02110 [Syntrophorhabdaceae bacterium]|nr:hypothetical protein [Syntrophorhabdaceae bacterium]